MLQPQDRLAVCAEPLVRLDRQDVELLGDPERLPHLHDLVVEVDGPRQAVQAREALVDGHAMAARASSAAAVCPTGP